MTRREGSELFVSDSLQIQIFFQRLVPGGIGTFEEFFEVLTLKQLSQHRKPIVMYNVNGYYDSLINMMKKSVSEGFMSDDCLKLFTVANTEQEVFEQIDNYKEYTYDKYGFLRDGVNNG